MANNVGNARLTVESWIYTPSGERSKKIQDTSGAYNEGTTTKHTIDTPAIPASSCMVIHAIGDCYATSPADGVCTEEKWWIAKNVGGTVTVYGPTAEPNSSAGSGIFSNLSAAAQGTAVRVSLTSSDNPN